MPLIVLVCMLLYVGIRCATEDASPLRKRKKPFTQEELDQISRMMMGKSQAECRQILRRF